MNDMNSLWDLLTTWQILASVYIKALVQIKFMISSMRSASEKRLSLDASLHHYMEQLLKLQRN